MNIDKKHRLIKEILSGNLGQDRKQEIADLDPVKKRLYSEWEQSGKQFVDAKTKRAIWKGINKKREGAKKYQVHIELWRYVAASIAILLTVGTLWITLNKQKGVEEYIDVIANETRLYILPDSSKVWMQPGSSIRYASNFDQDRNVWLNGNSLFEVRKHNGHTFRVHLNKAYVEVIGTCFSIKQSSTTTLSEITLFNGKISFYVESTKKRTKMEPFQRIIYNSENAHTRLEYIENIVWRDGRYDFIDIPLERLIKVINQMYDTNIILKGSIKTEVEFTGSIRYDETLDDVLDKLCFSLNLRKEKENNQIIIFN